MFAIALGIGSTTAVFSVVDRLLFRALPYQEPEQLVSVGMDAPLDSTEFMLGADYVEWRTRHTPFETLTSWSGATDCDLTESNPVRLRCAQVEATFLPAFGIQPWLGRNFTLEVDRPNAPRVVLLSHGFWKSRYASDASIIGKTLLIDARPATVIGVLPPDFELPTLAHADLLVPQAINEPEQRRPRTGRVLRAFARLKPGVSIERAREELGPLFRESLQFVPAQFRKEVKLRVRSLRDRQVDDARRASWMLLGGVLSVLLIACANVANLLLARGASREREMAIRAALGAGRGRLIRQTLTESLLLGLTGGLAGCGFAWVLLRAFVGIAPDGIPRLEQAALDPRILLFTFAGSVVSGLLFGLAPALDGARATVLAGWRAVGMPHGWFRQGLVAAQIAASLVLLSCAGLLLRSLWNMQHVPLGIRTEQVMAASITLGQHVPAARQVAFFEELEARLGSLPGVTALAVSDSLPPAGQVRTTLFAAIDIDGRPRFADGTGGMVVWRQVTPGYFAALDIPILRGRGFLEQDRTPDGAAIVIGESLARRLFPNEDPLGKRLMPGRTGPWLTVVGVARDVKNNAPAGKDDPEFYVARKRGQETLGRRASVIVRSGMDPRAVSKWLRAEIAALDPALPVTVEAMGQRVGKLAQRPRFNAMLLGLFAAMGLLLAAIGLYGVMAFLVARRTQEIGVRMALGATPQAVVRLVLGQAARWTLAGAVFGVAGSLAAARMIGSLLFGVRAEDPWSLTVALGVLLATALAAAWLPSRRAARIDPMHALRQE